MAELPGFRGVEQRAWVTQTSVQGWNAHPSGDRAQPLQVPSGTHLRLEQSDWCVQGCTAADIVVGQRFSVLDGPLTGRCVEFTAYCPDGFTSWIPDGLQATDAP
jgi:hypothetical protein